MRAIAADLPMDHLAIDLAQMRTSKDGMNYFLVVIDICTRFAWLVALPDNMGATVASALRSLFMTYGIPRILQSDNGTEFINLNVQQVLELAGVDHRRVTAYYPQANGAAERIIRSIKQRLNAYLKGDTLEWPHHVPVVQFCCNTSAHRRHGSTPFSLFFARPSQSVARRTHRGAAWSPVYYRQRPAEVTCPGGGPHGSCDTPSGTA